MKINKIITFLILINSLNISSQETEYLENGNFLDPVTIYGNLLNTDNTKTGKNITIIKSSELDNYNFNSIY